jgi:hypothetical protein
MNEGTKGAGSMRIRIATPGALNDGSTTAHSCDLLAFDANLCPDTAWSCCGRDPWGFLTPSADLRDWWPGRMHDDSLPLDGYTSLGIGR